MIVRHACCEILCVKSMLGNRFERRENVASPPPSTRWGLPRSMSVRPSLCVSWFPHSIAMYGTRDDVLSPALTPTCHSRAFRTGSGSPPELEQVSSRLTTTTMRRTTKMTTTMMSCVNHWRKRNP